MWRKIKLVLLKALKDVRGFFIQSNGKKRHFNVKKGNTLEIPESALERNYNEELFSYVDGRVKEKVIEKEKKSKEPKKKQEKDFFKELIKIKGIGKETAKDIVAVYPTKEKLIEDINNKIHLPFRNDREALLIKIYGGKK